MKIVIFAVNIYNFNPFNAVAVAVAVDLFPIQRT